MEQGTASKPVAANSIEGLASALSKVMGEMAVGGCVPKQIMDEASGHMSLLMSGIQQIAAEVHKHHPVPKSPRPARREIGSPIDQPVPEGPRLDEKDSRESSSELNTHGDIEKNDAAPVGAGV